MTDILSRLESRVSEDEWKRISAYAGISVAELKKKVAEAHQGAIDWQRTHGQTCFTITLPLISTPDP